VVIQVVVAVEEVVPSPWVVVAWMVEDAASWAVEEES